MEHDQINRVSVVMARVMAQVIVCVIMQVISILKNLMQVKICDYLIWLVTFLFIFLALINGKQADNISEMPVNFVPMNIGTSQLMNNNARVLISIKYVF